MTHECRAEKGQRYEMVEEEDDRRGEVSPHLVCVVDDAKIAPGSDEAASVLSYREVGEVVLLTALQMALVSCCPLSSLSIVFMTT